MHRLSKDSFNTRRTLQVGGLSYQYFSLPELQRQGIGNVDRLPYSLRILLENLLRFEDGQSVSQQDVEALLSWDAKAAPSQEIGFTPARVILQDFTGVPAVVDLAVMRDAMAELGGDPTRINPLVPADLVIDHSLQVDSFGQAGSFQLNLKREFERNQERYAFLRWGQSAFKNLRVVPPGTGIIHQVNLEYLGKVVFSAELEGQLFAYPDTLVGTDSHTTMINGLGILGWGVGGIEAEAAMLGQPISLLIPQVVGFRLEGELPEGATATDLVLTITQMLRARGVVTKFVEFFGPGISSLSLADRATIGNMSPEYGATCATFPVDQQTLDYLRLSARDEAQIALVEAYTKEQGLFHSEASPEAEYSDVLSLDLGSVEPSIAGPKRPQDRIPLRQSKDAFQKTLQVLTSSDEAVSSVSAGAAAAVATAPERVRVQIESAESGERVDFELGHGSVVIAAITSCTNTSNPSVMVAAGLLAKKAVERGLQRKPWVKTSLAPGSKVVTEYLNEGGLTPYLDQLGFNLVGYGCTTCIGNSGPIPRPIADAIVENDLLACAVLSGNRNFEGRISPLVKANYLASPPLVVAYALAGRMDLDLFGEPLGQDPQGQDVYLKDVWPTQAEVQKTVHSCLRQEMYAKKYKDVFAGDESWRQLPIPRGDRYEWEATSTYICRPSFFEGMSAQPEPLSDIAGMRVLALLGDSVTTDHISPAGSFPADGPAGQYLIAQGVEQKDFNSFGARRGNHEVMMRGTFANIRLRNLLVPGVEGGFTRHPSSSEPISIYEAAMKYRKEGTPLIVIAGQEYGSGSSRDWAAKGTRLLGVRVVLAQSYERIHRSNLIGMGVLPLQFLSGQDRESLGLSGEETFDLIGHAGLEPGKILTLVAHRPDKTAFEFSALARVDTPNEAEYYRHGGILHFVLRSLS